MLISDVLSGANIALPTSTKIFLSGAGLAMMKGSVTFLKENLGRNVIFPEIQTLHYSSPNYYSSIGLMDYVLSSEID